MQHDHILTKLTFNQARDQGPGQSDQKWYMILCFLTMQPHIQFGSPISTNIGDMLMI